MPLQTQSEKMSSYLDGERVPHYRSLSGIEYKEVYRQSDWDGELSDPGSYPFTRGIHKDMYRGRLWTRRQQSGFGSPEESNERIKYLLKVGQTGINMDTDVGTKLGLDPDYPLARADVGLQGTSLCTYEDMRALYKDIPLDQVSSTLIVQPPYSAVIMSQYLLLAKERGVPWDKLIGTIMNCALTQFVGPTFQSATSFFPIDLTVKIGLDVMEYLIPHSPRWNIVNINAYNVRETGVNAIQEAAFSISLAADYIKGLMKRGLDVDSFARRMAFFSAAHMDLFEEIAKLRAMRRIWARMLKEKFGAREEKSLWFRTAIQTAALPLTAQQPLNNIVRATLQTLAAVLAGTQSIHTTGYDEAYSLPTEESHKLSIRTQQIIAYESKVVNSADPLGGSYLVENLTDEIEERILGLMKIIDDKGGFIRCFKEGWVEEQINQARYKLAEATQSGKQPVVGVNIFQEEDEEVKIDIFRHSSDMQAKRIQYVQDYRKNRNKEPVQRALDKIYNLTRKKPEVNFMEAIMEAVDARATIQEICDVMRRASNFDIPE
ncbi:MAG: acyl-CoA mutase large subunit family protein [Desulfobacteraceae bacterium]|jgi:methylmalonyl-CoA mutase N-terminal domain/subunit|nr:acyl-CoA mutase large subunit family protein [Desulfobacteraceae bacterium]